MGVNHKLRRLFYSEAYGGIYVEATSYDAIKRWSWLQDVTGNAFHEQEYQEVERAIRAKRDKKFQLENTNRSV